MKICVTGKMGSLKSTFREILTKTYTTVFVVDEYINEIYKVKKKGYKAIVNNFGVNYTDENGVDKKKLLKLILNDESKLHLLENIINPLIYKKIKKISKKDLTFIELGTYIKFESYFKSLFDKVLLIKSRNHKENKIVNQNYKKNHIGFELDDSNVKYDYLIENNGSLEEFKNKILEFLNSTIF